MGWFTNFFSGKTKKVPGMITLQAVGEISRAKLQGIPARPFHKNGTQPTWFAKRIAVAPTCVERAELTPSPMPFSDSTKEGLKVLLTQEWKPVSMPMELLMMLDDPDSNSREVSRSASSNPEIAARILKLANSVEQGLSKEVTDVERAVILLGYNNVQSVIVHDWMKKAIPGKKLLQKQRLNRLWLHSSMTATCTRLLSPILSNPHMPSTLGLLHDLGKFVRMSIPTNALKIALKGQNFELEDLDATLGSLYAEKLGLPTEVVRGIELFPRTNAGLEFLPAPLRQDLRVVCVAEHCCHVMGFGDVTRPSSAPKALSTELCNGAEEMKTPLDYFDSNMLREVEKTLELVRKSIAVRKF